MSNKYFAQAKATRPTCDDIVFEDSRSDLLAAFYETRRMKVLTPEMIENIDSLYKDWFDLLFSGYNLIVTGTNSKFLLLETFKKRYLDFGRLRDWDSPTEKLKITTVRIHGLDPIELEVFSHAILQIKETRRITETDYLNFKQMLKRDSIHYVFMIHSIEHLMESCADVCEVIFKLYKIIPKYIHLVASSDNINGAIRLINLQHDLKLVISESVLPGIDSFLCEKSQLVDDFETNETALHRLFVDNCDLQSLKDVHQALNPPTQQILAYLLDDFIKKSEEFKDDESKNDKSKRKRAAKTKTSSVHLEFAQLLKYCESQFIVRRATALRDHLGELKDHNLIEYEDSDNKIKCLVDIDVAKKFLTWAQNSQG